MRRVLLAVLISGCGELTAEVTTPAMDGGVVRDAGRSSFDAGGPLDAGTRSFDAGASFSLRSVSPLSGPAGTRVVLAVEGLALLPTAVRFGSTAATQVQLVRAGVLECVAPMGAGVVDVVVEVNGETSVLRAAFEVLPGMVDGGSVDAGTPALDAGARQPTFVLEAEAYSTSQGIQLVSPGIGFVDGGDWLAFDDVDFGLGVDSVDLVLSSPNTGGSFELRLEGAAGPLLGTLQVASTGSFDTYVPQRVRLAPVSGRARLLVLAKGRVDVANLDHLRFNP